MSEILILGNIFQGKVASYEALRTVHENSVRTSQRTQPISVTKADILEMVAVSCENNKKHVHLHVNRTALL
jgi:hypothetical protein